MRFGNSNQRAANLESVSAVRAIANAPGPIATAAVGAEEHWNHIPLSRRRCSDGRGIWVRGGCGWRFAGVPGDDWVLRRICLKK